MTSEEIKVLVMTSEEIKVLVMTSEEIKVLVMTILSTHQDWHLKYCA
jgi:hypothetical protein